MHEPLSRRAFLAASFLSLFLEVLLIRWCGAEIRILAYVRNLTLLACFLGLGLGYAAAGRRRLGLGLTFATVAVVVAAAHPLLAAHGLFSLRDLSKLLNFGDTNSWRAGGGGLFEFVGGLFALSGLFAALAFAFVPIGQGLGVYFRDLPAERRVAEYTGNVAASLLGVAVFAGLSFLELPPWAWFAVAAVAGVLATRGRREAATVLAFVAVTAVLLVLAEKSPPPLEGDVASVETSVPPTVVETRWSPYQKIQLVEERYSFPKPASSPWVDKATLEKGPATLEWTDASAYVNGHWYSRVGNVDLDTVRLRSAYSGSKNPFSNQLLLRLPYALGKGRGRVLLLGAGMGRDAAAARAEGVADVDCVEIEPRFIEWGKELNPQHPYDRDEHVHVHVDDARRFLRNAKAASYDLVVFCYLDAHGLTSNFTNTNLDSYVYTRESLVEAKRLLVPDGVLALGFWSPRHFIYRRLELLLADVFEKPALRFSESLFMTGLEPLELLAARVKADPRLAENWTPPAILETVPGEGPDAPAVRAAVPPATTDDWPFFYLESRSVPIVHRAVLAAIVLLSIVGVGLAYGGKSAKRIDAHFLFLGAAFMLVETWAISRASLVYGATWYVSSAVIASLLVAVLAANTFVEKAGPVRFGRAFPCLLAALLVATLVDPSSFLDLPRSAQLVLAAPLYAVPFLFASAIFATSLARADHPDEALASNLLGSVLGGALECLAYATGLRSLGFVAIALYVLAGLCARRRA